MKFADLVITVRFGGNLFSAFLQEQNVGAESCGSEGQTKVCCAPTKAPLFLVLGGSMHDRLVVEVCTRALYSCMHTIRQKEYFPHTQPHTHSHATNILGAQSMFVVVPRGRRSKDRSASILRRLRKDEKQSKLGVATHVRRVPRFKRLLLACNGSQIIAPVQCRNEVMIQFVPPCRRIGAGCGYKEGK